MLTKKKSLPISELEPGMISAMDINFQGKILLSKDVKINEMIISKLRQNYIVDKIDIYIQEDSDEIITNRIKTQQELEATFNEFSSNLEEVFDNVHSIGTSGMEDIRNFTKRIHEEFKLTGNVIKSVVLYGSREDSIYRHSINVAAISFILGKWLGLNEVEINLLTYSAVLHDFGKMKIDDSIVKKNFNELTSGEKEIYKSHVVAGYNAIKKIPYLDPTVAYGVLLHHERMDGSGYPLGIKDNKIPRFAKIIAIADLFDQVSSNRYHKHVKGPFDALKIIKDESMTKLDTMYCNMFLNHIANYYMGEIVMLSNNQECKVIQVNVNDLSKPILLDDKGFLDLTKEKNLYVKNLMV